MADKVTRPALGIEDLSPAPKAVYGAVLFLLYHDNPPSSLPDAFIDGKQWSFWGEDDGVKVTMGSNPFARSVVENRIDDLHELRDKVFLQIKALEAAAHQGTLDDDQKAQLKEYNAQLATHEANILKEEKELAKMCTRGKVWMVRDSGVDRMPPLWKEVVPTVQAEDVSDLL